MISSDKILLEFKKILEELDFDREPKELYEPIKYSLGMGGKRIRPLLMLLSCDMFGGNLKNAFYPAVAIELFHNFTLIHDDIMDKAPLRRGLETVYRKWNQDIAILSGDTMFAEAYKCLAKTNSEFLPRLIYEFSNAAVQVCEGQQLDMNFENRQDVSIPEYINMIKLKTAALISCSLKIGAIIANAKADDADNIFMFGENIGIAFQITDDLLDVYGNEDKFGKANCGDIRTNKKTFLLLKALQMADDEQRYKLKYLYSDNYSGSQDEKVENVKLIFQNLKIKQATIAGIEKYYVKAKQLLDNLNLPNEKKSELSFFAAQLIGRDK